MRIYGSEGQNGLENCTDWDLTASLADRIVTPDSRLSDHASGTEYVGRPSEYAACRIILSTRRNP